MTSTGQRGAPPWFDSADPNYLHTQRFCLMVHGRTVIA